MDSRRDFIKKASMLSGLAGLSGILPASIAKALAIDPETGSTYLDAEHIVILMQENRSFDHCFGTLQGVRGFNDPRTITLPNRNQVWLQTDENGKTFAPFRLNIKETKSTWMGSLPHSWTNQVDARNGGRYDKWLQVKKSGHEPYSAMPLTMGYYNREDIPFYYALADAFTVCDQNFCSSLTGTTPNRLYLWTGTVRDEQNENSTARVRNEDLDYDKEAKWTTFPERLESNSISWKIYQNEISVGVGFEGEEDAWLSNFTDNPIEWFSQYHVKFLPAYIRSLPQKISRLKEEIKALETNPIDEKTKKQLQQKHAFLQSAEEEQKKFTSENFEKLTAFEKNLHEKAFTTNKKDPDYHKITTLKYKDGDIEREVQVPKGDILHQFREDVKNGELPMVSWLVAPENFSDHPGSPWYGAWYVSETMDILTKNPEIWKKTIFILNYDENDGYFDHIPPFVSPHPQKPETGSVSKGINAGLEYVRLDQDLKKYNQNDSRESSIGLGYRVPLVVASPWSRGGAVCSQVFDHTSVLQFLEKFLNHKLGKEVIKETNISSWRRAVCGDLTSVFKPYNGQKIVLPAFIPKDSFVESIHKSKFKKDPNGFKELTQEEIEIINQTPVLSSLIPKQEKGTRVSNALPYELYVDGNINPDKKAFEITFKSGKSFFGEKSSGAAFNVYSSAKFKKKGEAHFENSANWSYAVSAGENLKDEWNLTDFEKENYQLKVYGANGYFREFSGNVNDPMLKITSGYSKDYKGKPDGNIELKINNIDKTSSFAIEIIDNSYKRAKQTKSIGKGENVIVILDLSSSSGWYDFSIKIKGNQLFEKRYAGRVESGRDGITDPLMGGMI